jgi:hypothetical protein
VHPAAQFVKSLRDAPMIGSQLFSLLSGVSSTHSGIESILGLEQLLASIGYELFARCDGFEIWTIGL